MQLRKIIIRNFGIYKSDTLEKQEILEETYKIFIHQVQQEHQQIR